MRIRTLKLAVTAWFAVAAVCAVAQAGAGPVAQPSARPVVNINTATEVELCYLPGIGPALAGRIVGMRPYTSVDGLDEVKGIGPKKLGALRPYVTVSGATTATGKIRSAK